MQDKEETGDIRATICVVNYKTPQLIKSCLRSIRRFTRPPYRVIVVDNDSADESLDYLRSVPWIELVDRHFGKEKILGSDAEGSGLNIGLEKCRSEFYVTLHSDTIIRRGGWLDDLLGYFDLEGHISCVGSGKIESVPLWKAALKKASDFKAWKRKFFWSEDRQAEYRYHNRTICCLYRAETLHKENLDFLMGKDLNLTAGQGLYLELLKRGHKTVELPTMTMGKYVIHLNHATTVLNAEEFSTRKRTLKKYAGRVSEAMASQLVQSLLADDSLDK